MQRCVLRAGKDVEPGHADDGGVGTRRQGRDQCHAPVEVHLGQIAQILGGECLLEFEEPEVYRFGAEAPMERRQAGLIIGTDRPDSDR